MTEEINSQSTDICTAITISPDSTIVVSGYQSGVIRLWNITTSKIVMTLEGHKDKINSLVFTPDGKNLISGSADRRLIVWDAFKGDLLKILRGHWGSVTCAAVNSMGTILASGSTDKRIKLWDIKKDWKKIRDLKGHKDSISKLMFSPSDDLLASSSWDHTILFWNFDKGEKIAELKGHFGPVFDMAFSIDGKRLFSCSSDGILKLWDVGQRKELKQITSIKEALSSIAIHPNGKLISWGAKDQLIRLYNLEENQLKKTIKHHETAISDLLFTPKGDSLITLSQDGDLQIWSVEKLLEVEEPGFFAKAKEAIKSGGVKQMVGDMWSKSIGKILAPEELKQNEQLEKKMLEELPSLISVMKEGEKLQIKDLVDRYNCTHQLAEKVLVQLLKEEKVSGSFNPFTGIFNVVRESPSEIIQIEEDESYDVELSQTCFYCGTPLELNAIICPSCNKEIAHCPVCKLNIDFDDVVGVCVFCGSKGHLSHMKEAVKVTGFCPVCRKEMDWDTEITPFTRKPKKET
ncbi:MAG TPA: hypothetical protein VMX55_01915 [candidate division Zixibacteria bacterium]|nr:hypothetical protein [candidate division Zixibacteria bacterium]